MKKLFVMVLAVISVGGIVSAAVITNELGQVVTTTVGSDGVTVAITMPAGASSSGPRAYASLPGSQLDTNATTTVTAYTPRDIGDILIGRTGSTGDVWMATGWTTNNWKKLTP